MELAVAISTLIEEVLPALVKADERHAEALSSLLFYVDARCMHEECKGEAKIRMYWPGRAPTRVCQLHADAALTVAGCVGVAVRMERVA
jgi:hypothetical protein